ncbi:MAG: DUF3352 domain-containing protein [Cyanobacteria bacterium P01_H01_bin.119]
MNFRAFISSLAIAASVLLISGTVGFWALTAGNPLDALQKSARSAPSAAIFVPRQSPLMASLLVNPDRLVRLREVLSAPSQRKQAIAEINRLKQALCEPIEIDYREDLQPWLGNEITFAVTSIDRDRDSSNGEQPGYLWAFASQNSQRAREFIQQFWQKRAIAGASLNFEQYAGVQLIYNSPVPVQSGRQSLASAVVGNQFLLLANDISVLRQAIATAQANDLSLVRSRAYRQSLRALESGSVGMIYSRLPSLSRWAGLTNLSDSAGPVSGTVPQSALLGIQLQPNGILAHSVISAGNANSLQPAPNQSQPALSRAQISVDATNGLLDQVPASATLVASGQQLDQTLAALLALLGPSTTQRLSNPFLKSTESLAITAQNDLYIGNNPLKFIWADRLYALAELPNHGGGQPDWLFITPLPETAALSDHGTDDDPSLLSRLNQLAEASGLTVNAIQLDQTPVTVWTKLVTLNQDKLQLQTQIKGLVAQHNGYSILATSAQAMDQALDADQQSLAANPAFQQTVASLGDRDSGVFYLDWSTLAPQFSASLPSARWFSFWGQPLLDHLQSLAIRNRANRQDLIESDMFIRLVE